MRQIAFAFVCFAGIALGCSKAGNRSGDAGGTGGGGGSPGDAGGVGGGGDGAGGGTPECSEAAKLIYVVDTNGTFSSFKPNLTDINKSVFTDIGKLTCNAGAGLVPFSMSVDRSGTAWVEYSDGRGAANKLFKVSITDGSCTPTNFVGNQPGFPMFGMGFVSNSPNSQDETLFVLGHLGFAPGHPALGTLDLATFTVNKGANLNGDPELTGTGLGELWGFFASPITGVPYIAKIDKTTAALSDQIMLPSAYFDPTMWATAFYGGDFWVFYGNASPTTVLHVTASGLKDRLDTKTRRISGAGVSTCAPTVPIG